MFSPSNRPRKASGAFSYSLGDCLAVLDGAVGDPLAQLLCGLVEPLAEVIDEKPSDRRAALDQVD